MYGMVVGLTGPGQRFYVAVLEFPAPAPPDISLHRRIPDPERSVTVSASLLQTSTQGSPSVPAPRVDSRDRRGTAVAVAAVQRAL